MIVEALDASAAEGASDVPEGQSVFEGVDETANRNAGCVYDGELC